MRLRLLFTLGLVLLLSTLASSNECARYGYQAGGCKPSCGNAATTGSKAATTSSNAATIGDNASGDGQAANPAPAVSGEYSTLLVSKLLYI